MMPPDLHPHSLSRPHHHFRHFPPPFERTRGPIRPRQGINSAAIIPNLFCPASWAFNLYWDVCNSYVTLHKPGRKKTKQSHQAVSLPTAWTETPTSPYVAVTEGQAPGHIYPTCHSPLLANNVCKRSARQRPPVQDTK